MDKFNKIFITLFLLFGILAIYMGLNINLKCVEATMRDNLLAGLPLSLFGAYCFLTALFLWKKPQIGNILAVLTILMAIILIIAAVFDFSINIIKTTCST